MRLTSACRVFSLTGITWSLILKYSQAFQNAAWADAGMTLLRQRYGLCLVGVTYISGSVIPFVFLAQSRWVLTDIRIDSVPPEVAYMFSLYKK